MAYSGEDLFRNYRKSYVISPFQASQVSPLGYDLRIGHAVSIAYRDATAKGGFKDEMRLNSSAPATTNKGAPKKTLLVEPGGCILVVSVEQVYLGRKVLGTVQAKASVSIQGLFLNPVTVDPNFASDEGSTGRLILFLHNTSRRNVWLEEKQGIATLIMHEVSTETIHTPEKTGYEAVVKVLADTYDEQVIKCFDTYTRDYLESRGITEFKRDRRAVRDSGNGGAKHS